MHKINANQKSPFKRKVFIRETGWVSPASVFAAVAKKAGVVWLDSGMSDDAHKWSYIMWEPKLVLDGASEKFSVKKNGEIIKSGDDPFDLLKNLLADTFAHVPVGAPPFPGGVAGFFGYGLLKNCEPSTVIRKNREAREGDVWLGFYSGVIAFDHELGKIFLVLNLPEGDEPAPAFAELERGLQQNAEDVKATHMEPLHFVSCPQSNFTRQEYMNAVERVRSYIEDGDCYQVNISQKFSVSGEYDPVALYLKLRSINPAPFASYIDTGSVQILSSSPERFIRLKDGTAETRPVKGTRPRGQTRDDDARLRHELLGSDKERAENVMIVDLMRNDLSKVCLPDSVKVTGLCEVETLPTLFHLVSTVEGKLKHEFSAVDLLKNSFPAGSVTGAPKIRAMEIIDELEPAPRGVYCGAIGYIGYDGAMDMSVAIRVMTLAGNICSFHVGGGVTHPSNAKSEYQETMDKAKALLEAVGK